MVMRPGTISSLKEQDNGLAAKQMKVHYGHVLTKEHFKVSHYIWQSEVGSSGLWKSLTERPKNGAPLCIRFRAEPKYILANLALEKLCIILTCQCLVQGEVCTCLEEAFPDSSKSGACPGPTEF